MNNYDENISQRNQPSNILSKSSMVKRKRIIDEQNGLQFNIQKQDKASLAIPKPKFNFKFEKQKTQKKLSNKENQVQNKKEHKRFTYLKKLSKKKNTNEFRQRHQSLSQKRSIQNFKFMKEKNLVESIYEKAIPKQRTNKNLYKEYKRGLSQRVQRYNKSSKLSENVVPIKVDSLIFSQNNNAKEKNLSQINFKPVLNPIKKSKADIYLSNFQYKVFNQNGKSITNFVEKENMIRSKDESDRINQVSHVVKTQNFVQAQTKQVNRYHREPFKNNNYNNFHKAQDEYFNNSQLNFSQLNWQYNMNIEDTVDKLLLCWISKEFNYHVGKIIKCFLNRFQKKQNSDREIKNLKSFKEITQLKQELQQKKQLIIESFVTQQNLLQNLKNLAKSLQNSLKNLQQQKKVEFLFFLSILRYIKTYACSHHSIKYVSSILFKELNGEKIFVKKEIEIFIQQIKKKFDIEKIYKWFLENKKILNLDQNEFCKKLFEQMFQKKLDLDILREYSQLQESDMSSEFLYNMVYKLIAKKPSKTFKVKKKQILKPLNTLLSQSNFLGQNQFFLFFLIVIQKAWEVCNKHLIMQRQRIESL